MALEVALDGRTPLERRAWCERSLGDLIAQVCEGTGLSLIAGPLVHVHGNKVSGIAIIAESHVAIETDRVTGETHATLFSCKPVPGLAVYRVLRRMALRPWRLRPIVRTGL